MIGRTLSHYRIEERLGAGGMGEVYRARDEKLGRDVALKVLPAGSLADDEARRRFRKEAAVLSRLSHPHIATLHDFDTADGVDFLVMELVTGPTLEQELRKGSLPEKDVVRLGSQLARGLVAAHEQGVIHRDLKPSNLQLTSDGLLKILDFGVAHLERGTAPAGREATATETAAGEVLGSPPYMAPEQLLGKPVDARTDLYAAGVCLYELATGQRPHGERRGAQLTEAILHEAPAPPHGHDGPVSPGLQSVILKALDKDAGLRYQTARELLVDLERLQVAATSGAASQPVALALAESERRRRRRRVALTVVACWVVAATVGLWLWRSSRPPRITNARPLTGGMDGLDTGGGWATDGTRVYYLVQKASRTTVYQVPVAGGEPAPVPIALPVPYNQFICGYLPRESVLLMTGSETSEESDTQKGRALWTAPVPAGAPSRLGNLEAYVAAPSSDGAMLALRQRGNRLVVVRGDGTVVREWPLPSRPGRLAWSPDGIRLRFQAAGPDQRRSWIWEVSLNSGEARALWPGNGGRWTPEGRFYVFDRRDEAEGRNDIYTVREPSFPWLSPSQPVRLTFGPLSFTDVGPSPDGKHLFAWGTSDRGELLRFDAKAGRFGKYLDGASVYYVDASRDGQWLTWVTFPDGALWRGRSDGSDRLRLTSLGWGVFLPRWSPDGSRILFAGRAPWERRLSIFRVSTEGGEPELLARSQTQWSLWDPCWLPDGQTILYSHSGFEMPEELGIYRLDLRTGAVSVVPGSERLQYPKCSARGDILAMEKPVEGMAEAPYWAFFVDRGRWERLGFMPIGYPNWSSDGQSFTGLNGVTRRIERWSRATGRVEPVADVSDIPLLTLVVVPWMGLAPDGSPLVVRDRSTRDLYALDWDAP